MIKHEEVTILDEHECGILEAALRAYLAELVTIKGICKNPVIVEDELIDKRIAEVRSLRRTVHARTSKGKEEIANALLRNRNRNGSGDNVGDKNPQ